MRKIKEIVISGTGDQFDAPARLADLELKYKDRGCKPVSGHYIPFHYVIFPDGDVIGVCKLDSVIKHYNGHDLHAIHIGVFGGKFYKRDKNTVTVKQSNALYGSLYRLMNAFDIPYDKVRLASELGCIDSIFRDWFDSVFKDRLQEPLFYPCMQEPFEPFGSCAINH